METVICSIISTKKMELNSGGVMVQTLFKVFKLAVIVLWK